MRALAASLSILAALVLLVVLSQRTGRWERATVDLQETLDDLTMTNPDPTWPTYVADWKDANGVNHEVQTPREKDAEGEWEPLEEWAARHAAAVAALQVHFPPAGGS